MLYGQKVVVAWIAVASTLVPTIASSSSFSSPHPVIEWLRSRPDGYFSDKIVFENGGMFAKQDIAKGEHIMTIPPTALLGIPSNDNNDDNDENLKCATAKRLVYEYKERGESNSDYWPYVQYVFDSFPHTTVPMGWSKEGTRLVREMVGDALDPHYFGYGSYGELCGDYYRYNEKNDDDNGELLEAAIRIVLSRGWEHVMVPVFDMVNHRNGVWQNVDRYHHQGGQHNNLLDVDDEYRIVALKDISQGSQLHNSYNQCHDVTCAGIEYTYITPQIFADYGFVEQYPRRFAFYTGYEDEDDDEEEEDLGLLLEVDLLVSGELELKWLSTKPNADQVAWLETQWTRLKHLDIGKRAQTLTNTHEANMVLDYYQALLDALGLAIQTARNDSMESIAREPAEL